MDAHAQACGLIWQGILKICSKSCQGASYMIFLHTKTWKSFTINKILNIEMNLKTG